MILKIKCIEVIKTEDKEIAVFQKEEGKPGKKVTEIAGSLSFGKGVMISITDDKKFGTYEQGNVYNIESIVTPIKPDYVFPKKEEPKK